MKSVLARLCVECAARVVFLVLVGATFGAFFVAQRLKGAPQVVQLRGIVWFSPNGSNTSPGQRGLRSAMAPSASP